MLKSPATGCRAGWMAGNASALGVCGKRWKACESINKREVKFLLKGRRVNHVGAGDIFLAALSWLRWSAQARRGSIRHRRAPLTLCDPLAAARTTGAP